MSFWGVELKPDKVVPFVPPPEQARLHISQACLATDGGSAVVDRLGADIAQKRLEHAISLRV